MPAPLRGLVFDPASSCICETHKNLKVVKKKKNFQHISALLIQMRTAYRQVYWSGSLWVRGVFFSSNSNDKKINSYSAINSYLRQYSNNFIIRLNIQNSRPAARYFTPPSFSPPFPSSPPPRHTVQTNHWFVDVRPGSSCGRTLKKKSDTFGSSMFVDEHRRTATTNFLVCQHSMPRRS